MKIVVCIKQVPDTETRPKIGADGKSLDPADVNFVMSPYDEFAVEEAIQLQEKNGGEVVVVSVGDDRVVKELRQALAMGADRAVHCKGDGFGALDAAATAEVLSAAIRKIGDVDLVLLGKHGVGADNQQVGSIVAENLDLPAVTVVVKLEVADGKLKAEREIEGGHEIVECHLPALVTAQKGLNEPRYASLKGIMKAKKKPLDAWDAAVLELSEVSPRTSYVKLEMPPERQAGRIIEGEPAEAAKELARLLREEAKVI